MSKSISYRHHLRALARFPKDPLRPECQFQDIMRRRLDSRFLPASAAAAPAASSETAASHLAANRALDEKLELELEQANALYSLLENRYSRKYPITGVLMKPKSNPNHYTNLIKELEEAPRSGWMQRTMKRWKGFLRFNDEK